MTKGMDYTCKMVRGDTTIQILQVKFSFSATINITFCTAFVIGCFQFASYLRKPCLFLIIYDTTMRGFFHNLYLSSKEKRCQILMHKKVAFSHILFLHAPLLVQKSSSTNINK